MTWEDGQLPAAGSRVLIRSGHVVRYDVVSRAVIRVVHIAGTLTFAHDRDTQLNAGLIRIQTGIKPSEEGFDCSGHLEINDRVPRPALEVGTPNQPIEARHTALIRLHYIKGMDEQSCPAIVCCGGRMDLHGSPLSRTWLPLDTTANKGDAVVALSETPSGWKVGDRVIVTATHGAFEGEITRRPGRATATAQTEERRFQSISPLPSPGDRPGVRGLPRSRSTSR